MTSRTPIKTQAKSLKALAENYEGRGGSDQTSFYEKDIPVLFFHTGGHDDYHKPGDDAHKVDYPSLKRILDLEKEVIEQSFSVEKMHFRSTDKK